MEAGDLELIEASLTAAIATRSGSDQTGEALAQLGWADILDAESPPAVGAVFTQLGRACASGRALDDLVANGIGLPHGAAIVHPAWGSYGPPILDQARTIPVSGTAVAASPPQVTWVLHSAGAVAVAAGDVDLHRPSDDSTLAHVRGTEVPVKEWHSADTALVESTISAVRLALGHQLCGLAAGMLELARVHALDRMQFGRPIASFQAVRHKLAETLVAVTAAEEALAAAAENPSPLIVDAGRMLAGLAAQSAMRNAQQVLAGIGFTREHDLHAYLFAALELDGLYGTTDSLSSAVGRQLLERRTVPRLVDL